MARTTADNVKGILGKDYDTRRALSLTPFIDSASSIVDDLLVYATANSLTVTAAKAELIERWLAAHLYSVSDRPYKSKGTSGAQGSFDGSTAMGLDFTGYGQNAKRLDNTGYLKTLDQPQNRRVGMTWLGKEPSAQVPYYDRD